VSTVAVELPTHLRTLAGVDEAVRLDVDGAPTVASVLDALEARYPTLRGTIREHGSGERRAYIRFFAAGSDVSHEPPDAPLPRSVASGQEPLQVIGAIAGG
jgi:sulfur-carrier protein